jgi:LacI family transcriptional regulator
MKQRCIYFLVHMQTSFEQRILRGMARYARTQSPRWMVRWGSNFYPGIGKEVDGIVVFAVDEKQMQQVRSSGLPVVATSTRHLKGGIPCVVTDDQGIGELAAKHFREKYYQSFAYVGSLALPFGRSRLQAFAQAVAPEPVRVLELTDSVPIDQRQRELRRDLESLPPQTAVFCANDVFARMVLTALQSSRRKVPDDLVLLGVDADEMVSLSCPLDLSSVDSNPEGIGAQALELLGRMMSKKGSVPKNTVIRVEPSGIFEGSSTDALATSDERVLKANGLLRLHACDPAYSIDDLARNVGCSRRSLELRFAEVTGTGIAHHLWKFRLDRARELLRTTSLTLGNIAEQSGFVSPFHFSEKFKKEMGVTPGQFRKKGG